MTWIFKGLFLMAGKVYNGKHAFRQENTPHAAAQARKGCLLRIRTGAHSAAQRSAQLAHPRDAQLSMEPLHFLPRLQGNAFLGASGSPCD
ncbi:hypothetical protein DESC_370210 [Desulfosarcina cetonica]|nr:hypothetical protein DESC_370210 [Desulfosarcina cetonica]